jgi:hypothetical protein
LSGKLGRYNCYGARMNHGTERCISVSGLSIDAAIAKEVLRILKPRLATPPHRREAGDRLPRRLRQT